MIQVVETGWISCPRCSRRARVGQGFCELCGTRLHEAAPVDDPRRSHACEQCGATVLIPENERTATCAFCGTPYVRAGESARDRFGPEFVLPFTVSRKEAEQAFKGWIAKGGLLCPGDLAQMSTVSRLRGVYVPFWSFSMRSDSTWNVSIGEYWYETVTEHYTTTVNGKTVHKTRTRRVQHTEWYPLSGRYHQFHSGYLVSASRGLPQELADAIQPFPVSEVQRYAAHYLSGWLCEEYTMEREEAALVSIREFKDRERQEIQRFLPGDTQRDLAVTTAFSGVSEDLILLPVWIFAYIYGGKTYRFLVNGSTGKVHGKRPFSGMRLAILAIACLAIAALLVLLFSKGLPVR